MESFDVGAPRIGMALAEETAVLLSRAYTGSERVDFYSDEERERWRADIERAQAARIAMPADWLERFPTMRNLGRDPLAREDSHHFYTRRKGQLAGHVGVFQRQFAVNGGGGFPVAFIEDVATDPDYRHEGIASGLMGCATAWVRRGGYDICGLSTTTPEFYERLGWVRWRGTVHYTLPDGTEFGPWMAMVLPLNDETNERLADWIEKPLNAGLRGG